MSCCQNNTEDQNFEFGVWKDQDDGGEAKLTPLDIESWEKRQRDLRLNIMRSALVEAKKVVEEVDFDDLLHEFDEKDPDKRRRAAVFYVDKGDEFLEMVKWWIYTWRFIGLDSVDQGFDLVMLLTQSMCQSSLEIVFSSLKTTGSTSPVPASACTSPT